jgi:hypothetical protein
VRVAERVHQLDANRKVVAPRHHPAAHQRPRAQLAPHGASVHLLALVPHDRPSRDNTQLGNLCQAVHDAFGNSVAEIFHLQVTAQVGKRSEIVVRTFAVWPEVATSQFYDWCGRYGRANEQNGWVPRDFGLEAWEKRAILEFHILSAIKR